jgi:hypothetical protein
MTPLEQQIRNACAEGRLEHNTLTFEGFMRERHEIWIRRRKGQGWPWTQDPVLQEFRFCNVYRELDTVTIWVRENIRVPFADHPNLWFMLAAARQVNHPPMLEELIADKKAWPTMKLSKWDPERFRTVMNARKARGEQIYTGAYMLTNVLDKTLDGPHDKPHFTAYKCLGSLVPMEADINEVLRLNMRSVHEQLTRGYGWGGFLAYEVCCDLRWTSVGESWPDRRTFCHAGPGALRGLNRVEGRPLRDRRPPDLAYLAMGRLWEQMKKVWPKGKLYPALEMREIEHTLCEYDKHQRVVQGEGRPRNKYRPPAQQGVL